MKIHIKKVFFLISAAALLLSFQNCSSPLQSVHFASSDKPASSLTSEGNGYGYDGKPYVLLGSLCADHSNIRVKVVTKIASSAELVRENCQDIAPQVLSATDFQMSPSNPDQLTFRGATLISQIPTGAATLELSTAILASGFRYQLNFQFGTPADSLQNLNQSQLQIYENGLVLSPAHSSDDDTGNFGLGRFRHWFDGITESLIFSASDNSNPKTNGRVYSFKVTTPDLLGAGVAPPAKLTNAVDPRAYGAVGDGVTDNTAAFTAALNAGDLLIPDGTYVVKGTIRIPSGRSVQCASLSTVKIINPVVTTSGNQATFQFWTQGGSLSNCRISGADAFNVNGSAVFDVNSQYNFLVAIVDYYGGPVGNVKISNNIFENCHGNSCISVYGGTTSASNNLITQNTFRNCGHLSVTIDGGTNNTVSYNHLTDCSLAVQNDTVAQPNFNNILEKNYLTVTHGTGRGTAAYLTGGNSGNFDYSSNIVRNNTLVGNGFANSLFIYEAAPKAAQYDNNLCVMGCAVQ